MSANNPRKPLIVDGLKGPDGTTGGTVIQGGWPMPSTRATKAAIMGTRGVVRKFTIGAPGIGHGDLPGDIPPEGTPDKISLAKGGSTLDVVAASRQVARTEEQWTNLVGNGQVIPPPYDPWSLVCSHEESDALPHLTDAMATNMTGFGFKLKPLFPTRDDDGQPIDPPPEAVDEKGEIDLFIIAANIEMGLIGVMQCADRDVEITGNGYLEVLRDMSGKPATFEHAQSFTMRLGKLSQPVLVDLPIRHPATGLLVTLRRWRRFRTFVQIRNNRIAFFKQYGDPRFINWRTGHFSDESWGIDTNGNALDGTEIVHRKIYSPHSVYGVPRWVGASPHVRTARNTAELIVSWFAGAPIGAKLAMVSGGTWNVESYRKALGKIDDLARGVGNAWALLALEAESDGSADVLDDTKTTAPRMGLEDLAVNIPTELYHGDGNLLDGSHRRIARMFRLPPIYWGGSDDFSRAAANTARAVTEEQVFVPEREIRWLQWLNSELLPSMGVNFWALGLKGANTSDDSELAKGVGGFVQGGGASPNALIELWNEFTGQDTDPIPEPWGDRPFALTTMLVQAGLDPNMPLADTDEAAEFDDEGNPVVTEPTAATTAVDGAAAQDTALNGAQVQAALEIVKSVPTGELTRDMAKAMLIEFFNLSDAAAEGILSDVDSIEEPEPEPPPFGAGGPPGAGDGVDQGAEGDPVRKRARKMAPRTMRNLDTIAAKLARDIERSNPTWFA